ncbi:hypothetical protein DMA15_03850 [Streptomyces sp. WAC 01529]|uniref:hypothetical protein n=1 Tax=Streptomyces sp. WAC 01529 TaxID=2203205 RepID=UPI000F6B99E6|nr:hypothetical protein [Streptomyces sp. WAC 01529]AZM51827.1 hypothetical protein DMA15_03850 [Streptomyces sp. WAC 01529]
MSARDELAAHFTSDALADQLLDAYRAEVLREAEGVASEAFDAADERDDRAGADMAEQLADRYGQMVREIEVTP